MNTVSSSAESAHHEMSPTLVGLFSVSAGAIVANIYYAQPIIELIAPAVRLSSQGASLIVSLTQIGYALGLFFLVPLADLLENRRLLIVTALTATASLLAAAFSATPGVFLFMSLLVGLSSVTVQILIPLAAHLAPERSRGRVVGNIMSGLLLGILLARPLSSFLAQHFGWRAVFMFAAAMTLGTVGVIAATLPRRVPEHTSNYGQLLGSLWHLFTRFAVLRERALYQGLLFGTFSLFWTSVPLELTRHYGLTQEQIGLFALVGALGAAAAPVAGRLADAGYTRGTSLFAMIVAAVSLLPGLIGGAHGVVWLGVTGVALDFAVQMNMVLGQRAVYALDAASRGRLNALYMTSIFVGGAMGSAVASTLYNAMGWAGIVLGGGGLVLATVVAFLVHQRGRG
ncbi:MFS transporter [Paraburkholderia dinghuensis]|uniref:MFS transporter n=1 Tax=Paraburkholderia dinghuensis TaxID=2305225 RepID=A0A3N6N0T8_9BURK|nr:MFS transporter [Paraburkholderia dinghuensis]RQH01097.1 MFS transporter [Paraburkholderia dinghuensis]